MTAARRNLVILWLAYGLSAGMILHQVAIDAAAFGSNWRQGEWLINGEAAAIRRGLLGSGLIRLSDATGIDLLALVFALPLGLMALILGSLLWFAARDGPGDRLLLLLLSPGFVLFWGADPESTLRKEVLIYTAFLPLILVAGHRGRGWWALVASVSVYALAAAGHEMSVFFAPALVVAILICRPRDTASWLAIAAVAGLGALSFGYALLHPMVPDKGLICAPLLARGLRAGICDGAIDWLVRDMAFAHQVLLEKLREPYAWTVLASYAAALLPFVVAQWGRPNAGPALLAILLAGLPFLPLWVVAIDWGRWINAHVAVMVFLVLILLARGKLAGSQAPLPRLVFLATLLVCLTLGIRHVGGPLRPGLIPAVVTVLTAPQP